jgi:protein subunit release factor A
MAYIPIPDTDEELLNQCEVDTFRSSGKGGQNVNRRETAVRLTHRPTGIVVSIQNERNQLRNKQIALDTLRERLKQRNRRRKPRVPTKTPRAVKEKRLQSKKKRGLKKQLRKKPSMDD